MDGSWCPNCSPEYIDGKPSCSCRCHDICDFCGETECKVEEHHGR